ncbi:MAG: glycoside hydrolase family 53 protein [Planctomycetota bacterium]|jgi:arabinogalactan endo-1,4-beta-galactosidase
MRAFEKFCVFVLSIILCSSCWGAEKTNKRDFLVGGDISMLTKIEEHGGVFRDEGNPVDFLKILKMYGCNCQRLRIFVHPTYRNAVVQDTAYTIALAKRIKSQGMKLLLNFHYSDTWADPGHQKKPVAWAGLDFEELVAKVTEYTSSVIDEFNKNNILPDMVQIGNEITPGMLWPDGKLSGSSNSDVAWQRFTRLLKAGVQGVRQPLKKEQDVRIMIHVDCGGNNKRTQWFFDNLNRNSVPYDIIGVSFYPWWHGTMDNLLENLRETTKKYAKDIMVVETAYPYRGDWSKKKNMLWPITQQGQYDFLVELVRAVRQVPENRGIGVLYWYPESIPVKGLRIWNGGSTALFDTQGNALPALKAFASPIVSYEHEAGLPLKNKTVFSSQQK